MKSESYPLVEIIFITGKKLEQVLKKKELFEIIEKRFA